MHVQRVSVSRGDYPGLVSGPTVPGAASTLSSHSPLGAQNTGQLFGRGAETQGREATGLAGGEAGLCPQERTPCPNERQLLGEGDLPGCPGRPFGLRRSDSQEWVPGA